MDLVNAALGASPSLPNWNANADLDRDDRISVRDRVIVARANDNAIIDSPTAGSAFDANADGMVSARDALVIINHLGRQSATGETPLADAPSEFDRLDVNRDGRVSALDALRVINRLAENTKLLQTSPAGEAEVDSSGLSHLQTIDTIITGAQPQHDRIDDELLRLLADDQFRIGPGVTK